MKYYSTAKLALSAITNARLLLGVEFEPHQIKRAVQGANTFLLYPSPEAQNCEEALLDSESTVIVVDGTWEEAGKILFRNPELKEFPCLTFEQPLRSNYRIRKQPRDNYLSTIESIAQLLKLNAAAQGLVAEGLLYDRLLAGFDRMVEEQLRHIPKRRRANRSGAFDTAQAIDELPS
jgi:DTW domain-containing protein YfiP